MKTFHQDEKGQLILGACVSIVVAMILIAAYEYSILSTGENSINHENKESTYFYINMRDTYSGIYRDTSRDFLNMSNPSNITVFEKEMKEFALLHGYSVEFQRDDVKATIIFIDKELRIKEEIYR